LRTATRARSSSRYCSTEMRRRDKENYYLDIAQTVAVRSTCLRRNYGAIIVVNDEIVATGYNGAPRGRNNCIDIEYCQRDALGIPSGERYELCRAVHAEANAIISAARRDMLGGTLYLVGLFHKTGELFAPESCSMCKRLILNAGINRVVCRINADEYTVTTTKEWIAADDTMPIDIIKLTVDS